MNQALSITLHIIIGSFVTGLFQNIQEQTKALVFVFVFVLVYEQALTCTATLTSIPLSSNTKQVKLAMWWKLDCCCKNLIVTNLCSNKEKKKGQACPKLAAAKMIIQRADKSYCSVLKKWELFIKMRASYLQPSSLHYSFFWRKEGAKQAALILMKNCHFNRTQKYPQKCGFWALPNKL